MVQKGNAFWNLPKISIRVSPGTSLRRFLPVLVLGCLLEFFWIYLGLFLGSAFWNFCRSGNIRKHLRKRYTCTINQYMVIHDSQWCSCHQQKLLKKSCYPTFSRKTTPPGSQRSISDRKVQSTCSARLAFFPRNPAHPKIESENKRTSCRAGLAHIHPNNAHPTLLAKGPPLQQAGFEVL